MSRSFVDTMLLVLILLPPTVAFLVPLSAFPRSPATTSRVCRSRKNGISMEIPAELEGILDPSKSWEVKFTLKGETKTVVVSEETSLLEAAEEAFEDLVYSCRSGVCNSCAGHCTQDATANEGKASFAIAVESLSDEYMNAGFVLTCTTHPTGPGLHVILNQQEEMLGIA